MITVVNDLQEENAPDSIDVTLFPIVIVVNDEHTSNAQSPIDVTLFPIRTFFMLS